MELYECGDTGQDSLRDAARYASRVWLALAGQQNARHWSYRRDLLTASERAMELADGEVRWAVDLLAAPQRGYVIVPLGRSHQCGGGPGRRGRPVTLGLRRSFGHDATWEMAEVSARRQVAD